MIEIKIYRRHDILSDIIKIVSHANQTGTPVKRDEFFAFLKLYMWLYPPLYAGVEINTPGNWLVVSKTNPGNKNDIICELKFPTQ